MAYSVTTGRRKRGEAKQSRALRLSPTAMARIRKSVILWEALQGQRPTQGDVIADGAFRLYRCLWRKARNRGMNVEQLLAAAGMQDERAKFTGVPDKPVPRVERDGA